MQLLKRGIAAGLAAHRDIALIRLGIFIKMSRAPKAARGLQRHKGVCYNFQRRANSHCHVIALEGLYGDVLAHWLSANAE